jgi:hydrogenase 3 maturation protease
MKIFLGGAAPENLTGPIKEYAPTHLVVVDSAQFDARPGTIQVLDTADTCGMTFSTHSLPLSVMLDYIVDSIKCETLVIGIEPKTLDFDSPVSPAVDRASHRLAAILHAAFTA